MSRPKQNVTKVYASLEPLDQVILRYYMEMTGGTASEVIRDMLRRFASADSHFDIDDFVRYANTKKVKEELENEDPDLLKDYSRHVDTFAIQINSARSKRKKS